MNAPSGINAGGRRSQVVRKPPAQRAARSLACFTVDVEQDCPPYLNTCLGMTEGMPALLSLLKQAGVHGTFFVTGEMARRFPGVIHQLVAEGHELGCHGDTHRDFTTLDRAEAEAEIANSLTTLRGFAPVKSFRAPYLQFPAGYLRLLVKHGITIDSSVARYKFGAHHRAGRAVGDLTRIPASATSSVLRLPRGIRRWWLGKLRRPLVLFVHPWEAVDWRSSELRLDCRFATGVEALAHWRRVIADVRNDGLTFRPLGELPGRMRS